MLSASGVHFGIAKHGWLPVTLEGGDGDMSVSASFTPYNSLGELVDGLLSVLICTGERTVRWNTEPVEYHFRFTPTQSAMGFAVHRCADRRPAPGAPVVFAVQRQPADLARTFWRALRRLEGQPALESQWGRPFPALKVQRLRELLEEFGS
jgi:hypothetical protein